jgi:hypothetical protein
MDNMELAMWQYVLAAHRNTPCAAQDAQSLLAKRQERMQGPLSTQTLG